MAENALLRIAIEKLPLGLSMFDQDDKLLLANKQYGQIWNLPEELSEPGTSFSVIMKQSFGEETEQSRSQSVPPLGISSVRRREWRMDNGRHIEIVVTRLPDGRSIALHEDVTAQRQAEAQITYLAEHDQLTGLPNRNVMLSRVSEYLQRNERGDDLAALWLNLGSFKLVNDSYGHSFGDKLLCLAADRLRKCSRKTEFLARCDGDEFVILQCGPQQPASSSELAQRLIDEFSHTFNIEDNLAQVGLSVGIALAPGDGNSAGELIKNAHLAMDRAKENGRNTFCYFESQMDARIQSRRVMEIDLRSALQRKELHLAFQPLLDLKQGKITAFETLLRWRHPSKGNVSPADFISVAEQAGLIIPIGQWVLAQACQVAKSWPSDIRVSVNLSPMQLAHASLIDDVNTTLADTGLDASRLEIEITESVMMEDPSQALIQLQALSKLGVRLAIDDFGTGYSSLSYLHSYPFDRIKIDRSFVRDLENNPEAQTIISAMVNLGVNLNLAVTVEGIETEQQLQAVRSTGAGEVQGFLFSKPLPAEHVVGLLNTLKV
ncbi:diguanylate cyclase (GGDEF) domain-containing protein [Alteromonadaceae bacterium Bs31]|nr:diguanylate cyclase (GGDEF) domain-containing protein [Alteromonadaceae bacterium Bs31]